MLTIAGGIILAFVILAVVPRAFAWVWDKLGL